MNETELENMVIRLTGDGSSFQQMMQAAQSVSMQTVDVIKDAGKQIEDIKESVIGFGQAAVSALAAMSAERFLQSAFSMYAQTETGLLKLRAAVTANGGAVDETMESYRNFARTLRETQGVSGDETIALLKRAEALGITGQAAQRATQAAINLSAATDGDAQSAMRVTAALEQGNVHLAMQYAHRMTGLRGIRDETEFVAKAQQLMNIGQQQAEAILNSSEGVVKRYQQAWKMLTKQFGEFVADAVKPVLKYVTDIILKFTDLDPTLKKVIVGAAFLAAGFLAIGPAIGSVMSIAAPFFRLFFAGWALIGTLFSPLGALFAVVAIGIVGIVGVLKDIPNLWQVIERNARAAWDWLEPVRAALKLLWDSIIYLAVDAFTNLKTVVMSIWNRMTFDMGVDWNKVRDVIVIALNVASVLIRNFGSIASAVYRQVIGPVTDLADAVVSIGRRSVEWVYDTIVAYADLVKAIAGVTFAVLGAIIAYKAIGFVLGIVNAILTATGAYQLISAGLWIAWTMAVVAAEAALVVLNGFLAIAGFLLSGSSIMTAAWIITWIAWIATIGVAKAAMWLFNVAALAFDALMFGAAGSISGAAIGMGGWTFSAIAAKVGTWLLNIALTGMNVLLGAIPVIIGVAVMAVLTLAAAFGIVTVAVTAAMVAWVLLQASFASIVIIGGAIWAVLTDITSVFAGLPSTFGPIGTLTTMFTEWWEILKKVAQAAKVDMPLAWQILQQAARLALSQVKDLWQPLWAYIKDGFYALWNVIVASVAMRFEETAEQLRKIWVGIIDVFTRAWEKAVIDFQVGIGVMTEAAGSARLRMFDDLQSNRNQSAEMAAHARLRTLRGELSTAQSALNTALLTTVDSNESQATRDARAELNRLMSQIPEAERRAEDARNRHADSVGDLGRQYNQAKHDVAQFDAVLRNSAEGYRRIAAYRDMLNKPVNIGVNLQSPTVPRVDVPNHSWYSIYGMPLVTVRTALLPPTVPQIDVPNHSWYSIYGMPVVEIPTELDEPGRFEGIEAEFIEPAPLTHPTVMVPVQLVNVGRAMGSIYRQMLDQAALEQATREQYPVAPGPDLQAQLIALRTGRPGHDLQAQLIALRNQPNTNNDLQAQLIALRSGQVQYFPLAAMLAPQTVLTFASTPDKATIMRMAAAREASFIFGNGDDDGGPQVGMMSTGVVYSTDTTRDIRLRQIRDDIARTRSNTALSEAVRQNLIESLEFSYAIADYFTDPQRIARRDARRAEEIHGSIVRSEVNRLTPEEEKEEEQWARRQWEAAIEHQRSLPVPFIVEDEGESLANSDDYRSAIIELNEHGNPQLTLDDYNNARYDNTTAADIERAVIQFFPLSAMLLQQVRHDPFLDQAARDTQDELEEQWRRDEEKEYRIWSAQQETEQLYRSWLKQTMIDDYERTQASLDQLRGIYRATGLTSPLETVAPPVYTSESAPLRSLAGLMVEMMQDQLEERVRLITTIPDAPTSGYYSMFALGHEGQVAPTIEPRLKDDDNTCCDSIVEAIKKTNEWLENIYNKPGFDLSGSGFI